MEELEHRTEHVKRLLGEIERQDLNFTAPTAEQWENELDRTEIPQVAA